MSNYVFFKFKKIDKNLIDSLSKSYLHFASVKNLNDPIDCQIDICASITSAIARCDDSVIRERGL